MGVILVAGAWYAYTTRSVGAALCIGMILREVWRSWPRRGSLRTWLCLAALTATFIPLSLVSSHLWHSDSTYGGRFLLSPMIRLSHLIGCLKLFSYLWIDAFSNSLRIAAWAVTLPLALWEAVLIPYWNPVDRYLGPLYSLYLIYAWDGLNALLRYTRTGMATTLRYAAAYIRNNTPDDALIVTHEPRWVGLFTGRRSSILPYDSRFSGVVDRTQRHVGVYGNADFEVYEVRPSAAHADCFSTGWNL